MTIMKNVTAINNDGPLVWIRGGSLAIGQGSRFVGNTGGSGSVIVASRSNVSLNGVLFDRNSHDRPGGCLELRDQCRVMVQSVVFTKNLAMDGACILASSVKSLIIRESIFEGNTVLDGGCVSVKGSADATSELTLSDSHFAANGIISRQQFTRARGSLTIQNFDNGNVLLESTSFGHQAEGSCILGSWGDSTGMVVTVDTHNVSFSVKDCSFTDAIGALASGLRFVDISGQIWIERSRFFNIHCCDFGHAVYFRSSPCYAIPSSLNIIDCNFSFNFFLGSTIYATGKGLEVAVNGSHFEENEVKSWNLYGHRGAAVLYATDIHQLHMSNCTAVNNIGSVDERTGPASGSVHIDRTENVKIESTKFVANSVGTEKGNLGGAIHYASNGKCGNLELIGCTFEDNIAADGGALYGHGLCSLIVTDSVFQNNSAVGSGGALLSIGSLDFQIHRTAFLNNKGRFGGGISFSGPGALIIQDSFFLDNEASMYGGGIILIHDQSCVAPITGFYVVFRPMIRSTRFHNNNASIGGPSDPFACGDVSTEYLHFVLQGRFISVILDLPMGMGLFTTTRQIRPQTVPTVDLATD